MFTPAQNLSEITETVSDKLIHFLNLSNFILGTITSSWMDRRNTTTSRDYCRV